MGWPLLPSVPDGPRPLWSVMIPTYNCAQYLQDTLASVLAQDPGPGVMQIEVVDDCSTSDNPEAVVREFGAGRVSFHRRPANGGHVANFRTCLERSRGHLIHLLHGDDAVRPGFYDKLLRGFEAGDDIGAAFCRQIYIDEKGQQVWISEPERQESGPLDHWLERIAERQLIQTPSIAVRRKVYETIGTFDPRLSWSEDWEMWVRIAAHYGMWHEVEPLALYRVHQSSSTATRIRTGENLRDARRAVEITQTYLPPELSPVRAKSLRFWAEDAITNRIPLLLRRDEFQAALAQLREASRCSRSEVLRHAPFLGSLMVKACTRRLARWIRRRESAPT
ncbi:glycosyltransferase family 2 protein [Sphingosinicella humi]|uniref:Family 2 glycosyl transferase n=1 Tax=Allosphingosinicella humi TaxID=2068657 RepID=A0A2U2J4Z3_9SPHN|nr:glycosyltransferase [Sphingosinicella humi]PWG03423.1 family 2 glycosyl transferase [Sphingosinicella humi]